MCGMDFHNGTLCCGLLCPRIISLYFSTLFLPLSCAYSVSLLRLPRQGLPHSINIARAITPSPLHGYHACVFISRLPRHSSEFHFWVITPELSRSTTHVNRVITPALVSTSCFTDHRLLRQPSSPPTPPPGRHTHQPTPHWCYMGFTSRRETKQPARQACVMQKGRTDVGVLPIETGEDAVT